MNDNLEFKLQEFEDWLIDEMRFSPSTVNSTIRKMKFVSEKCDLTREGIQEFIRRTWHSKGNKTANGYIQVLNRWLKFQRMKPMAYFKEYDSFTIKFCTPEQERKLLRTAKSVGAREEAMIYLLFGTGARLQEACDLRLSKIGEETITVIGKGQKERTIYLPPEARDAIERYRQERHPTDKEHLFTSEKGKMSHDYFRKRCEIVSIRAGIKFHPHMARHTYATKLLKQGISVSYVARMLGHEDLSSTQIYLHPSQEDAIEEVRKVEFFLGTNSNQNGRYGLAGNWTSDPIEEQELVLFYGEAAE